MVANRINFPESKPGTNQHTVSKFLLRPFQIQTNRGNRVWVFDKRTNSIEDRPIKRILCQNGFYDESTASSLDGIITGIEDQFAKVLHSVKQKNTLTHLDFLSQKLLSLGLAVQWIRTPKIRRLMEASRKGELIDSSGAPLAETKQWYIEEYGAASATSAHLDWLADPRDLADLFLKKKTWMLLCPSENLEFVISDHPVAKRANRATSQLAIDEGTYYLPLGPSLTLALFDPHDIDVDPLTWRTGMHGQIPAEVDVTVDDDEVRRMNRLQYEGAEQFVISRRETIQWELL